MYCVKCGNKLNKDDKFCTKCGSEVKENKAYSEYSDNTSNDSLCIVLGIFSLLMFWFPLIGIILGICAIVSAKKYKNENNKNSGGMVLGIIGLVLSIVVTVITILGIVFFSLFVTNHHNLENKVEEYIDRFGKDFDYDRDDDKDKDNDDSNFSLGNNVWRGSDKSVLYLNEDDSYYWYMNDKEHEDNYFSGTYSVYNGIDAVNYIVKNFADYNFTYDKQMDLFGDGKYNLNNYYLLVLDCDKAVVNGKEDVSAKGVVPYYGFYDEDNESLSLINMKSGNDANFSLYKSSDKNGIM